MNPVKVFRYGAAVAIENREWGGGKDRNPHLTQGAKVLLYDGPEFKREANLFDLPLQRQERRL
jgi:hypothetical protein